MEWWYFTGRLRSVDASVRGSGYQFTFVRPRVLQLDSDFLITISVLR